MNNLLVCRVFINKIKYEIIFERSQAYDAAAIHVDNVPDGVVNQPVEFESKKPIKSYE